MRDLKEILEEVHLQCTKDGCQSVNNIALLAMRKAIEEYKMSIVDRLESLSNSNDIIQKEILDTFIEKLELESI